MSTASSSRSEWSAVILVLVAAFAVSACKVKQRQPLENPSPSAWVGALPPGTGTGKEGPRSYEGMASVKGRFETLSGAVFLRASESNDLSPATANIEISVEQGKARAYLGGPGKNGIVSKFGYAYVEATPGKPARFSGNLIPRTGYWFMLEAVDGPATGLSYRVW